MEGHGQNLALFQQIQRFSAPHRYLMGEYPVHLPALSGQVRVHIALQGDVGVGMSQQFAEGLYIAPRLQTGRCKGMTKRMRMRLMDTGFFQIAVNALTVASRFDWLFLIARKKPRSAAEIFRQLLQNTKQRFWKWNLTMGILGLGRLNDDFCVAISTRNPSHCPLDRHSSCR